MKMEDIALRIRAHLRRFETDPKINVENKHIKHNLYYNASCYASGNRIFVTYISYQGPRSLTKSEALAYLAWLDAGNVGKHWETK